MDTLNQNEIIPDVEDNEFTEKSTTIPENVKDPLGLDEHERKNKSKLGQCLFLNHIFYSFRAPPGLKFIKYKYFILKYSSDSKKRRNSNHQIHKKKGNGKKTSVNAAKDKGNDKKIFPHGNYIQYYGNGRNATVITVNGCIN